MTPAPNPFPSEPLELRALLFERMRAYRDPQAWRRACAMSGRLSSWTFANSILAALQHHIQRSMNPSMPEEPTLLASAPAWARAGRYAKPGATGYRLLRSDETGRLTVGLAYDVSQTDGQPLMTTPFRPDAGMIVDRMRLMAADLGIRVEESADTGVPAVMDGRTIMFDASLPAGELVDPMARLLARIPYGDLDAPQRLENLVCASAAIMVTSAFGLPEDADPEPTPSADSNPEPSSALTLLEAGGIARGIARRIIAFCGAPTGFRDGSLLAPGPRSDDPVDRSGNGNPRVGNAAPTPIIEENPVPAIDPDDPGLEMLR